MATTVNKGYQDAQIINESPRSNYIYKDLNLFFTKHPMSSDVSKVTDVQAIKRSIRNLILTNKGERLFHPEIGGNVQGALFELFTPITKVELESTIEEVIGIYEPRAVVTQVRIEDEQSPPQMDLDENRLNITVFFYLINEPTLIHEVDVILTRLR